MGTNESAVLKGYLSEEDVDQFVEHSYFNHQQINYLAKIYQKIAKGPDSRIDQTDFIHAMKISNQKIGEIMYHIMDKDGDHSIDFKEFVEGLNKFLPQANFTEKAEMCFKAYDSDGGGSVSAEEIRDIIEISLDNNPFIEFSEAQKEQLISDLIKEFSKENPGELNFDEFSLMVSKAPGIIECFDINVTELFNQEN